MWKYIFMITLIFTSASALSNSHKESTRRNFFTSVASTIGAAQFVPSAYSLDMDAFMNQQLQQDVAKELSDDEKLCKYGAPAPETGEACARAGMSTKRQSGGVDAYGNINRGDFVRCKTTYPMIDGKYVKTVTCS